MHPWVLLVSDLRVRKVGSCQTPLELMGLRPKSMPSKSLAVLMVCGVLQALVSPELAVEGLPPPMVRLSVYDRDVVLDNGILEVNLTKPEGNIAGIRYNGVDNLLEHRFDEDKRAYWDVSWDDPSGTRRGVNGWPIRGSKFKVIQQTRDLVEVSFTMEWNKGMSRSVPPLSVDKRYIMLRGSQGLYAYGIYEHKQGWPDLNIFETRIVFKLDKNRFRYMAISDDRQRMMPMPEDRLKGRGEELAYKEAVLLINPTNPLLKGEVDDKYQYSMENEENRLHGWIASEPATGFWMITPSNEFRTGGPLKQDLTSHTGPVTLSMFVSCHYSGPHLAVQLRKGEYWKKVFGPIFVYLNSNPGGVDTSSLWGDAKLQMQRQIRLWPYDFAASVDFPKARERGSIIGRLYVRDWFISKMDIPASKAYVGLTLVGDLGSWQTESKGYQFWTRSDIRGFFLIRNVRAGVYSLFAWVPGFIGEYKFRANIVISPGKVIRLGHIVFEPPRQGPTIWEIGIPDRSAAEFFIPDPDPKYMNKLYIRHPQKFRQYGLWERYTALYPRHDLVYRVGISDWRKDWFFAHVTRRRTDVEKAYAPTTWQIRFYLRKVFPKAIYKLRLAIASAEWPTLIIRFNNPLAEPPHARIRIRASNNAIARHGARGMYWLFSLDVRGHWLVQGQNVLFLTQRNGAGPFIGLMYDYLRLEGP